MQSLYFCRFNQVDMKLNKSLLLSFGLLIVAASLYRAWPDRPYGFAPQMAMALFGGAMIKDKRLAFLLPLLSMFISDAFYQLLYNNGFTTIQGFYEGQAVNYLIIAGITVFGFLLKKITALRVIAFSISGSILFFLASNFATWAGGGGYVRPKTFDGLMLCYYDGLAFLRDYGLFKGSYANIFVGDLFFCFLLFGSFYLFQQLFLHPRKQLA